MDSDNKYTKMQYEHYQTNASKWTISDRDIVVGSFDSHNNHKDYELLFKDLDTKNMVALDFGCGPARNIVKFWGRFERIDGVDIAQNNLNNAKIWMRHNNIDDSEINLYLCNGTDLSIINDQSYDVVFSTICLQHICVHSIRYNYFKEFYRVLKNGGYVTAQMGYGLNSPLSVGYYENYIDATSTNRGCDTRVEDPSELQKDLEEIGFTNFQYTIRPVGPGDTHPNWIFFRAQKQ
jgi:ubiquinone/menaquinone biosynthesis C-methylase UbiE